MIYKKTAALFFSFIILILIPSGCGKSKDNSEIVGSWVPSTATLNGDSVKYSDLELEDGYFELTFNSDGTCTAILTGIEGSGTYVFNGTSVDVTIDGDTQRLTYENSQLTLSYEDSSASFVFVKKK